MASYKIHTTNGPALTVEGDHFGRSEQELTGDFYGYEVTKDGELVAFISPQTFVSVTVK